MRQSSTTPRKQAGGENHEGFRHEALLYSGLDGFIEGTLPFLSEAAQAEEPTLVVVSAAKIGRLRGELGRWADRIVFADMAELGGNPARIIPAWRAFVDRHAREGRRLRGIGEPISAERSPAELVECQRHEALLNLAFADAADFRLLCPYDTNALDADVIAKAHHSHPVMVDGAGQRRSLTYVDRERASAPFADPLSPPPPDAYELPFAYGTLGAVRAFVAMHAAHAGLREPRAGDLVLAVNEIATNSVRHGGGHGSVRLWSEGDAVLCDVVDRGRIAAPLAGREKPPDGQLGGHGLWLVNQVCDLVQVRAFATHGVVRVHMRRR
ncbi:MAG TPA: sensor histidine kinase [Solirubrobacteraceae bacterium]